MPVPTLHSRRIGRALAALLLVAAVAGCTMPATGPGTLAGSGHRILDLVNGTGAQIGAPVRYTPATAADPVPCRKHFLGYTISRLSTHRAEVRVTITFTAAADGASLLPRVESYWKSKGWPIDRSGMSDHRYPKLRTHVGDDLLVATGYVGAQQVNLYGVSPCVRS
jgi:hypothetical protein